MYSSLTKSIEQLFNRLLVVAFCILDTEIVRFGDKTSRRLSLIIWSAATLTRLFLLVLLLWLLLAIGEPIEEQASFLSCAVVPVVLILVVQADETIRFIEAEDFGQLSVSKSMMCGKKLFKYSHFSLPFAYTSMLGNRNLRLRKKQKTKE